MREVEKPTLDRLSQLISSQSPEINAELIEGELRMISVPSIHPEITVPLTIRGGPYLEFHWYGGYFYDIAQWETDEVTDAYKLLQEILREECGVVVAWQDGVIVSGGPTFGVALHEWSASNEDCREARFWRGTRDAVLIHGESEATKTARQKALTGD